MNTPITTVLCKNSFRQGGTSTDLVNTHVYGKFEKGVFYNKFILEKEDITTEIKINYKYKYIYIYNNDTSGGYRFHLDKNKNDHYIPNFYDYFYDDKEIRKIKLNEINNSRKSQ